MISTFWGIVIHPSTDLSIKWLCKLLLCLTWGMLCEVNCKSGVWSVTGRWVTRRWAAVGRIGRQKVDLGIFSVRCELSGHHMLADLLCLNSLHKIPIIYPHIHSVGVNHMYLTLDQSMTGFWQFSTGLNHFRRIKQVFDSQKPIPALIPLFFRLFSLIPYFFRLISPIPYPYNPAPLMWCEGLLVDADGTVSLAILIVDFLWYIIMYIMVN